MTLICGALLSGLGVSVVVSVPHQGAGSPVMAAACARGPPHAWRSARMGSAWWLRRSLCRAASATPAPASATNAAVAATAAIRCCLQRMRHSIAPGARRVYPWARERSVLAAEALGVRVGGTARDRLALVLVGGVDLLAVDRDAAVLMVAPARRAEIALWPFVVSVVALLAAQRLVLALVRRPILEVLRGVIFELGEVVL